MSDPHRQRRLAFGQVAELYDSARPAYPAALFDDLLELAAPDPQGRVLEVGAGTGRATLMLAARGARVLALEPDPAMAAVARRNCAGHALIEIEQLDFESWRGREPVAAIVSAQAWHWVAAELRYARAAEALARGGTLAAIWTLPLWGANALLEPLRSAYRDHAPGLAPEFPMHPASAAGALAGDWAAEIGASAELAEPRVRTYRFSQRYSSSAYLALLGTHQDHILLAQERRQPLFAAIAELIDGAGAGTIVVDFETRLCTARRL